MSDRGYSWFPGFPRGPISGEPTILGAHAAHLARAYYAGGEEPTAVTRPGDRAREPMHPAPAPIPAHDSPLLPREARRPPRLVLPATPFTSLVRRGTEWQRRIAMVRCAQEFLYTSTYFYHYDRYGREYAGELIAAASRGVDTWLVVDGFGQRIARALMSREEWRRLGALLTALRAAGVHLVVYRAPTRLQRLMGGGLHVKVQVSEAGEAILSSGNISATSFTRWNEYAMALRGPIAAQLLDLLMAFIERPVRSHLALLRPRAYSATGPPPAPTTFCVAGHPASDPSPLSPIVQARANPVTRELVRLIDAARRTLRITSFYFKPAPALFRALERAARRGVQVEIHHSHRDALPESVAPWLAATFYYRRCLDLGMKVYENRHGEHSKIVVADDRWAAFGTYNLEHAADDRLAEVMVITDEPAIVTELVAVVKRLAADPANRPVDRTLLASLPLALKVKRLAVYPVRRWV